MNKLTIIGYVSALLLGLAGVGPAAAAKLSEGVQQGPVMKAHVINVGQANSTHLEFPCGAILIDAGAQDDQKVDALVNFLNGFFARRTDLDRTLKSVIITHNHIDHTRALQAVVKNFKVERYIDHGMLEGPGTGNPNWARDEVEEGTQSFIRPRFARGFMRRPEMETLRFRLQSCGSAALDE